MFKINSDFLYLCLHMLLLWAMTSYIYVSISVHYGQKLFSAPLMRRVSQVILLSFQ